MPQFRTKNALFGYFRARILENYCQIWNQHSQICQIAKFCGKIKVQRFGTKNASFGYFWAGILENYCHIWNQFLWVCLTAKLCEETKMLKCGIKNDILLYFWPRMPYLGIFGQEFYKNYCKIWNQHPRICTTAKFGWETKMPKFGTKNALCGYFFLQKMPHFGVYAQEF